MNCGIAPVIRPTLQFKKPSLPLRPPSASTDGGKLCHAGRVATGQRLGRRFAKERSIVTREPAQVGETEFQGDRADKAFVRVHRQQDLPGPVEAKRAQLSDQIARGGM